MRRRATVQWSIALARGDAWRALRDPDTRLHWLQPDRNRFYADPMLVRHATGLYLFVEEYRYEPSKGIISAARLRDDRRSLESAPEPVLVRDFHLSFPTVFAAGGEYFMLPEQKQSRELVLYRSTGFPHRWRPYRTIFHDRPIADPVLLHRDGYWWLFCSYAGHGDDDNNLHLYYARSLDDEFRPHPHNPLRCGLHGSRMAGPPRLEGNRLLRPAQDCRAAYGDALVLWEITELDPERYAERAIAELGAARGAPFPRGRHTLSICDGCLATDGYRFI